MRRREFIALLGERGGSRTAGGARTTGRSSRTRRRDWPITRPSGHAGRVPILFGRPAQARFRGGPNLLVEFRPIEESVPGAFAAANELVAWKADVLFAFGSEACAASGGRGASTCSDRHGSRQFRSDREGYVQSLARPGGNVTGFILRWRGGGGEAD